MYAQASCRQNDGATGRLLQIEGAQVDVTNGTSLSVDDAAAGSSLHQVTSLDTAGLGYG